MGQLEAVTGRSALETQVATVYADHAPALRRRCLGLTGNATAADDLMQETLARFIARLPALPDDLDARAYLFATARNVWVNHLRQRADVVPIEIHDVGTPDERIETDPVRALLLAEERADVRHGTASLTERQRRALTLRELGDHSYAEVGSELGLQSNAVAQIVWRARTQLRRSLRRSQIDEALLSAECRARIDVISDLVDETTSSDTAALEAHLTDCGDCRRTFAVFQEAGSRLRGVLPLVPLAAIVTRVGTALRIGDALTSGIGGVAAVTAAVVVTAGGGGALIEHYGALPAWTSSAHHAPTRRSADRPSADRGRPLPLLVRRTTTRPQITSASSSPTAGSTQRHAPSVGGPVRAVLASLHTVRIAHVPPPKPAGSPAPGPVRPAVDPPSSARPPQPVVPPERVRKEPDATPPDGAAPGESPKTPPGQAKKLERAAAAGAAATPSTTTKAPPGQAKKAEDAAAAPTPGTSTKKTPPGQAKKASASPGQVAADAPTNDAAPATSPTSPSKPAPHGKNKHGAAEATSQTPSGSATAAPAAPSSPSTEPATAPVVPTAVATPPASPPPASAPPASSDGAFPSAPTGSSPGNGNGHGNGPK